MLIRPATPADNQALCRMELLAPQGSDIRITENRRDFFFKSSMFPDSELLVIEDEKTGSLISVMAFAPMDMTVGGERIRAAYMFDWRSNPEAQRGIDRTMMRLWLTLQEHARAKGARFIFGHVKSDNERAISIYDRIGTRIEGTRRFFTLPVFRKMLADPDVQVETKIDTVKDYREMEQAFADHDMWPIYDNPAERQKFFDKYLCAKISKGCTSCKIWDVSQEYDRVVMGVPLIYRLLRPIRNVFGTVIPLPKIPATGDSIKTWSVFDLVVPEGESPLPLLRTANNLALKAGADYLIVSVDLAQNSRFLEVGRGSLATLDFHLFICDLEGKQPVISPTYYDIRYL
ncbi:MAG: GNAT family N-acetyltransferase [Bacillota bacterium]|jgi:RimJ/RimL family protein N-acetyltransferase